MAHKKGASSSRNGRDSNAQRLGVKRFGGQRVLRDRQPLHEVVQMLALHQPRMADDGDERNGQTGPNVRIPRGARAVARTV